MCNGEAVRQKHHSAHEFVDPMTGIRQLEVKADVSRNDVEEYFGLDGYGCECIAWSSFGQVKSRRAKVVVACKSTFLLFFFYKKEDKVSRIPSLSSVTVSLTVEKHLALRRQGVKRRRGQQFFLSFFSRVKSRPRQLCSVT